MDDEWPLLFPEPPTCAQRCEQHVTISTQISLNFPRFYFMIIIIILRLDLIIMLGGV